MYHVLVVLVLVNKYILVSYAVQSVNTQHLEIVRVHVLSKKIQDHRTIVKTLEPISRL